ncbi:hypothetical protein AVEN_220733-1 [Araneus ventricosus]|uniref:Uncharacterized protein n=1 Tax=Araneus ventricosus TaxID=182803 RepID=A0A4Y2Q184_ARAVE|nr:hypothetical protein AVEN_220733-1 [Araneus ventricosus]
MLSAPSSHPGKHLFDKRNGPSVPFRRFMSGIDRRDLCFSQNKATSGYDGNDEVDRLAKEVAESDREPLSVKAPISFLKSIFKKKMMEDRQSDWDDEDTGRSTFNILPRVSTQPYYWKKSRFLQDTAHFPRT